MAFELEVEILLLKGISLSDDVAAAGHDREIESRAVFGSGPGGGLSDGAHTVDRLVG